MPSPRYDRLFLLGAVVLIFKSLLFSLPLFVFPPSTKKSRPQSVLGVYGRGFPYCFFYAKIQKFCWKNKAIFGLTFYFWE